MLNVNGTLTRAAHAFVALLLCACAVCAQDAASAQASAAPWLSVTPDGEEFQVKMPKTPTASDVQASSGGMFAAGRRYESAGDDSNTYAVWSLTFKTDRGESIVPETYMNGGIPPGQSFLDFV